MIFLVTIDGVVRDIGANSRVCRKDGEDYYFVDSEGVRDQKDHYAPQITRIQNQVLYDLDGNQVKKRIEQENKDRCYRYGLITNSSNNVVAVTSLKTSKKPLSDSILDEKFIEVSGGKSIRYLYKELRDILQTNGTISQISGLSRDKKEKGKGLGKYLADIFLEHICNDVDKKHIGKIYRATIGYFVGDENFGEMYDRAEEQGYILSTQLKELGVKLPLIKPFSKNAARAARNQGFVVAGVTRSGGPLWVQGPENDVPVYVLHPEKAKYEKI